MFLTNHASQIVAADLFVVPSVTFRLLFVLVMLAHERRRIHVAITAHPTADWVAQQRRNAFPEDQAPRYLVPDRAGAFADVATAGAGMQVDAVRTAPRSPWQNAYVERLIGLIGRECLDHVIVVNEVGLRRVLASYVTYYMGWRTHLGLAKDSPLPRPVQSPSDGCIVATPRSRRLTLPLRAHRRVAFHPDVVRRLPHLTPNLPYRHYAPADFVAVATAPGA